ncbi:flagellar hook-associated protein FlgL [Caproicibacter sp.]|uniref:flagellar hook-associated protein FlgL n=1 Tax=Caproicibacter sp. TaxID=2814884 RepID=UPI003989E7CC
MRITTGMISSQYNKSLNLAFDRLNKAGIASTDFRQFEKPSDNPFLAGQAFQVRRQLDLNENYSSNIENLNGMISSADTAVQKIVNVFSNANNQSALEGINGATPQSARNTLADNLISMRDSLVSTMNAQYSNRYLFSGAGGEGEAPFTLDGSGNLLYRGINVDTGENTNGASTTVSYNYTDGGGKTTQKSMQIDFGTGIYDKLNGYTVSITSGGGSNAVSVDAGAKTISITTQTGATKQDLQDLLQGAGGDTTFSSALSAAGVTGITSDDLSKISIGNLDETGGDAVQTSTSSTKITNMVDLDELAGETSYVDIGLGIKTDANGNVVDQSAFNAALPGISYLGYGMVTKDGTSVPKNAYSLMTKMAATLKDSSLTGEQLMDTMKPYMDSFTDTQDTLFKANSELGNKETLLKSTSNYITNVNLNLQTRDESVESVDPATAFSNLAWEKFSYQAALQVSSSILQPTLLDFMK